MRVTFHLRNSGQQRNFDIEINLIPLPGGQCINPDYSVLFTINKYNLHEY